MNLDSLPKATREFILPLLAEAWYEGYWVGLRGTDDPGNIDNPYKEDNR
jgi:hypothetical protein